MLFNQSTNNYLIMKLDVASDFFKSLKTEANKKSEIKVYDNFIGILTDLKNRQLTEEQLESIEEKLEFFDLETNPENKKRYYSRKLTEFKKYLKDKFSLISEGYNAEIGLALGLAFGVAFGSVFGMGVGISLGMVFGLAIGTYMDSEAKKQNLVYKTK